MIEKKLPVIVVVVIYVILVVLFFNFQNKRSNVLQESDSDDSSSVRFCCENEKLCTNKFFNDNFNKSLVPATEKWNPSRKFKTVFGHPECYGKFIQPDTGSWILQAVVE
jgi:hypothetical protein